VLIPGWHLSLRSPQKYIDRAFLEYGDGNYVAAISDFTEAIRINRDYAAYLSNRGECYAHLKQYQKAISDFTEIIRLYPKSFSLYEGRADIYNAMGDRAKAAQDLRKAQELRKALGLKEKE
jgi:tetratricopeptide (TPR) repeat protein